MGHFGWHTFRHTYATLLKGNGEDVKVVQELMRHPNISVTLNIYAQAITQSKRDAQRRVVSLLLDKDEEKPSTEADRTVTDLQNSGGDLRLDWTIISIRTTRVDLVQFPGVPYSARQLPPVLRRHRRLGAMSSQIFGLVRHANYRQFGNAEDQNSP